MRIVKNLKIPGFAFLLFFPGFFAYHSLVGLGYLTPFLGGFFRPIAIIFLPIFVLLFFRRLNDGSIVLNRLDCFFVVIFIYSGFVGLINYALGSGLEIEAELLESTISRLTLNLAMYLLARTVDYESHTLKKIIIFSLLIMCGVAFFNIGQRGIFYLAVDVADQDSVAGYQSFARSIVVVAIFALAVTKSIPFFLVLSIISLAGLFVNGARSELIGFVVSLFFVVFYKFNIKKSLFGLILLISSLLVLINIVPSEIIEGNRFMELLYEGKSSSVMARSELSDAAIVTIVENPLLGDYGSYALATGGGVGSYAHNLLSAWVDLGVFGFILYVASFLFMGLAIFNAQTKEKDEDVLLNIVVGLFFFTIPLMLLSKDYGYLLFGLTIGFVARMIDVSRRKYSVQLRPQGCSKFSAK